MPQVQSTREQLLHLLLQKQEGATIDEMATALRVSRNAVRQHLATLETEGLVAAASVRRLLGRPSHLYALTAAGREQFPKQYSMLSGMLLAALRQVHGEEGTRRVVESLAATLSGQLAHRVTGDTPAERAASVAAIMNSLEYVAKTEQRGDELSLTAVNCVYHHLAPEFPEVCDLDVDLLSRLLGGPVDHTECMARGGRLCRFVVPPATAPSR